MDTSPSVIFRRYKDGDSSSLASMRADEALETGLGDESTLGLPPSKQQIHEVGSGTDEGEFLVGALDGMPVAYSTLSHWQESSGVTVFLVDGHVANAARGQGVASKMLERMESTVMAKATSMSVQDDAVFAGNASTNEPQRVAFLEDHNYVVVFSMVEMVLPTPSAISASSADAVDIGTAEHDERGAIWELNELIYKDRPFTTPPSDNAFANFLQRSAEDLGLWFVARDGGKPIAFVNSRDRGTYAEITDVTIHPAYRRHGIARALLTHNLEELNRRGFQRARLHTNGEDISGALSLYQSIGFEVSERRLRYRKAIGDTRRLH